MKPRKKLSVLARFRPRITADLNSDLVNLVGTETAFIYHKYVDDEDTPYSHQWVLTTEDPRFGDYWFPECDLEILQDWHSA